MNEANETIFNNWREFIHRETEKIINLNLEHKPYDSLKSQELITAISQQVLPRYMSDHRQTHQHQQELQVHREPDPAGQGRKRLRLGRAVVLQLGDGRDGLCEVGEQVPHLHRHHLRSRQLISMQIVAFLMPHSRYMCFLPSLIIFNCDYLLLAQKTLVFRALSKQRDNRISFLSNRPQSEKFRSFSII